MKKLLLKQASARKAVLAVLLATTPLALAADRQRVQEIGHALMCVCGCNQTLTGCNMIACPSSGGMKEEVAQHVDQGKTDEGVIAAFVEKYGVSVLSSPPASGFNLMAWVMPFLALGAGIIVVMYFVKNYSSRTAEAAASAGPVDTSKYRERVESELENFTPED